MCILCLKYLKKKEKKAEKLFSVCYTEKYWQELLVKIIELNDRLSLTNNGDLCFFFIGTGSAFSKKNYQNNLLIIKGKTHLLIDCGTLCPLALSSYNSSISDIRSFLITHSHADHIGGLEEAALIGRYNTKRKPDMIITDKYKKILWNQSLKGGCSYGERSDGAYMTFDDYFTQIKPHPLARMPRPIFEIPYGSLDLKIYRTRHIPDNAGSWRNSFYSIGILVDNRILFPADTQFDTDLLNWMTQTYPVEYIFHDCQFREGGVHASYNQLKTLPAD